MGSLFRSNKMGYFSLYASHEFAWELLNDIGELDALQFLDLNASETSFKRPFSNYVKRCEDMETKIGLIEGYLDRFNQLVVPCDDPKQFLQDLKFTLAGRNRAERTFIDDVEADLEARMHAIGDQIRNFENIVDNYNHLLEFKEVLTRTRPYVAGGAAPDGLGDMRRDIRFNYLAGVINKEDSLRFRRLLFRITRGMTWTALIDIPQQSEDAHHHLPKDQFIRSTKGDSKPKTVFIIVYQGGAHDMLKAKLNRACESFGASKYGIPEDPQSFNRKLDEVEGQLNEAQGLVKVTQGHLEAVLRHFSRPGRDAPTYSHIVGLKLFVLKEKALYHALNNFQEQRTVLRGNCWIPLDRVKEVEEALANVSRRKADMGGYEFKEIPVPGGISPPTNFNTNSFTNVFQEIVNTYGVPRYREINPGLFTIATFPFLFGVMFGDIGHGALLFIFGAYLCLWQNSIEKDKTSMTRKILPFRYLLLLQGLFAFYCGLIYNDFTSMPLDVIPSCYPNDPNPVPETGIPKNEGCNFPFGIDQRWFHRANELTFMNSFKMKLAIILGVSQMTFGILLRGLNSIFTRKWLDFIFEFIPMLVLLTLTFGYMVFLIFMKWSIDWTGITHTAPAIINIFIRMALNPGSWDDKDKPLFGDAQGNLQAQLQLIFLLVAGLCAVLILIPKPLILYFRNKSQVGHDYRHVQDGTLGETDHNLSAGLLKTNNLEDNQLLIDPTPERQLDRVKKVEQGDHGHDHGDHFDMGEIAVHQIIETIEFVLGTISNTASYLRLWALSLAHSQLAKVFFDNSIGSAVNGDSVVVMVISSFISYWIFANITLGVILLMDQMECFLHALRLHWVEFQNKFYKADGYAFEPFSYKRDLQKACSD